MANKGKFARMENGHAVIAQCCDKCSMQYETYIPIDDYDPKTDISSSACLDCLLVAVSEKQQEIIETQKDVIKHQHSEILRLESFILEQDKKIGKLEDKPIA